MDLNSFGESIVKHLARIANSLEVIEAATRGGSGTPTGKPAAGETKVDKGATKPDTKKPETKKEETAKPKHSRDEVNAALVKLKDDCGGDVAKAIIKDVGGVNKMADIPDDKLDAVFKAAEDKHAEMVNDAGDDDI